MRFTQNLEAVANAENESARFRVVDDRLHRGRETRNGARPQVVAVTEPTRHDDAINIAEDGVLGPDLTRGLPEHSRQRVIGVLVAVTAGKLDDADLHDTNLFAHLKGVLFDHRVAQQSVAGFIDLLLQFGLVATFQLDLHELSDPHILDPTEIHRFERVFDGLALRIKHGLLRHYDDSRLHI